MTNFIASASEFLVNELTTGGQTDPKIQGLVSGGFVASWVDLGGNSDDLSGSSVKAQVFDASGQPLGTEFLVNTNLLGYQHGPVIGRLANGGFVISWMDASDPLAEDTSGYSVKAQVYSSAGTPLGLEILVNTAFTNNQWLPAIAGLTNGGFVVTWEDQNSVTGGTGSSNIKAQLFNAIGQKVGTEFLVNNVSAGAQALPMVTALDTGGFVVSWHDDSTTPGVIKAQIFGAAGSKVGNEFQVSNLSSGYPTNHTITALENGSFVVSWQEQDSAPGNSDTSIRAQVFSSLGARIGSEILVNSQVSGAQTNPAIASLSDGGFVVSWVDRNVLLGDGNRESIKAQVFSVQGSRVGAEFLVNTEFVSSQTLPTVTGLAGGGFAISWQDASGTLGDSSLTSIKGRIFEVVSTQPPVITSNGRGATASVSIAENNAAVTVVTATYSDPESALQYTISGGADAALFEVNSATGALRFKAAPNFEEPSDSGADNIYDVVVQVAPNILIADGTLIDTQSISVRVTNIAVEVQQGTSGDDILTGDSGSDELYGLAGNDRLTGGLGNDKIDGGEGVDTVISAGNSSAYNLTQTSTGIWSVTGPDGTDTLANAEYIAFDDQILRLLPGSGTVVDFETDNPATYMTAIRDFDGNNLGGASAWKRIGSADVNGDGDIDEIFVNQEIARFAEVATAPDGQVYFSDHGWAGETRVVGIYIDPLVSSGEVTAGGPFDSQRRFQNDLRIDNINRVLGADDYDGDGLQEVYFALTDGTAYLHAYMHADGNIRYANYQSEQQVIEYLTQNGWDASIYAGWFPTI